MTTPTAAVFAPPDSLAAKADPALTAADERFFATLADHLDRAVADLSARLDAERQAPAGSGQRALDRDQEVHRLTARLRTLRRFGVDLCLGRMVAAEVASVSPAPVTHQGATTLIDAGVAVTLLRVPTADAHGLSLTGTWPGQDIPLTLAHIELPR